MPIVRGHHDFDESFTRIPNAWVRDRRLSLKAIGLLVQLLSHSPGWRVSIASLANANNCGVELIRSAVKELMDAGYIRRSQERIATRFGEAVYETCDPSSAFPLSAFPSSGNPTPKKTSNKKTKEEKVYADSYFETFWEAYPRKVGRQAAYRAFISVLVANDPLVIIAGAQRYAADPNLPVKQYIPYPATWINRHGWLDEALPERERDRSVIEQEQLEKRKQADERHRADLLRLDAEARAKAEPAPKCKHGKNLASCLPCCRELAKDSE